ncbi:Cupredoxin [Tribonema minus]|uniref:Cupredoxin n=1 Tax=Tribonema minus TaxID=303371 RepID=A0A835Z6H6_9STRA|nr:Cupredoxin [Tribonema minus]
MRCLLTALLGVLLLPDAVEAVIRQYYVAAEEEVWDYAPMGKNLIGDTMSVTFANHATQPYSMHPHGVQYAKTSEGASYYMAPSASGAVAPGEKYTYVNVPERSGPGPADGNAIMWAYHSHTDEVTDENKSHYLAENCAAYGCAGQMAMGSSDSASQMGEGMRHLRGRMFMSSPSGMESAPGMSNMKHNINGLMYGNLQGLKMAVGSNARWFVTAFGSEVRHMV